LLILKNVNNRMPLLFENLWNSNFISNFLKFFTLCLILNEIINLVLISKYDVTLAWQSSAILTLTFVWSWIFYFLFNRQIKSLSFIFFRRCHCFWSILNSSNMDCPLVDYCLPIGVCWVLLLLFYCIQNLLKTIMKRFLKLNNKLYFNFNYNLSLKKKETFVLDQHKLIFLNYFALITFNLLASLIPYKVALQSKSQEKVKFYK